MESDIGFQAALEEAKQGAAEGGVPIGACLVSADGKILGRGHNMRIQKSSAIIHVGSIFTLILWPAFTVHHNHITHLSQN
jgi:tRNA(Arg) A34 adenosine deaminase TadA